MLAELMTANSATAELWTVVPQMTAGWLFGISYQEIEVRDKLMSCYKHHRELTRDYYDAMAAYEDGDT